MPLSYRTSLVGQPLSKIKHTLSLTHTALFLAPEACPRTLTFSSDPPTSQETWTLTGCSGSLCSPQRTRCNSPLQVTVRPHPSPLSLAPRWASGDEASVSFVLMLQMGTWKLRNDKVHRDSPRSLVTLPNSFYTESPTIAPEPKPHRPFPEERVTEENCRLNLSLCSSSPKGIPRSDALAREGRQR